MTARSLVRVTSARLVAFTSTLVLSFALVAPGCGDDTGGGTGGGGTGGAPPDGLCFQNPLGCEEGTVCAFDDEDGKSMTCLPAGSKGKGNACKNVAGQPECGEGMVCLQLKSTDEGECTPYCDSADDCSGGLECATITTDGGKKFYACAATSS